MKCMKCNKEFDENYPMKVYLCGHSYHKLWCPGDERPFDRIDYRYSTAYNKEVSLINANEEEEESEDKCQYCEIQRTKGNIEMK